MKFEEIPITENFFEKKKKFMKSSVIAKYLPYSVR